MIDIATRTVAFLTDYDVDSMFSDDDDKNDLHKIQKLKLGESYSPDDIYIYVKIR